MTPKFENSIILPESQKLIPELPIQVHGDKYSYVKSKVKALASPFYSSKSKKDKKRNITRIDMNLLTYLKDNKKKSFSSDGSESSEGNARHHKIVLNINNVFSQDTINQNLSPHFISNQSYIHDDRMTTESKSPKMPGCGSSKLMSPFEINEERNMSSLNERSEESSNNLSRSSIKSHTNKRSTRSRLQRLYIHNKNKDKKRYEKKVTGAAFHNIPSINFKPNMVSICLCL